MGAEDYARREKYGPAGFNPSMNILSRSTESNGAIFKREILSLHKTKGLVNFEETKQLFLNNVLSESLDDGRPLYYNSNILGRYMRKDYGQF